MAEGDQHMDILPPDRVKSERFTKASCVVATKAVGAVGLSAQARSRCKKSKVAPSALHRKCNGRIVRH
eukprot:s1031_g5.t1